MSPEGLRGKRMQSDRFNIGFCSGVLFFFRFVVELAKSS